MDVAGNDIYGFSCGDVAYGSQPMPGAQSAYGSVSFSYSQSPDGPFGPWDVNNAPGLWYVKASVEPTVNYKGAEAVISFTLLNEELQAFVEPEGVHVGSSGDVFSNVAAALPTELELVNTLGLRSQHRAKVWWDIEYMAYDSHIQGAQVVTVTGTASLPQEVNNSYGVPLEVSIQVYIEPGLYGGSSTASDNGSGLAPAPSPGDGGLELLPGGSTADPFL